MSRWIDADALIEAMGEEPYVWTDSAEEIAERNQWLTDMGVIESAPSIDIVRCKECEWLRYCETEDLDLYLDCDCPDGGGIPRNEEWFCADGKRRE